MIQQILFGLLGGICGTALTLWVLQLIDNRRQRETYRKLHDL
jgi:ABC-type lipoprotein release transport system permease subunit